MYLEWMRGRKTQRDKGCKDLLIVLYMEEKSMVRDNLQTRQKIPDISVSN